jgi:putative ABC transport system permease protein
LSLRRYTLRSMQQRPGRTILTMLSIVIGVTATVGVGLGTATTRNAYKQMFAMVTGRATLEVDGKGGKSIPGDILEKVASVPGVEAATPLLDRPRSMTVGEDRQVRLEVLGIDPDRDQTVRDYTIVEGRQVKSGDEIALEKEFAAYLGVKAGDDARILTNTGSKPFKIAGIFSPRAMASLAQMSVAFMPIDRAQRHFCGRYEAKNSIDKIQVVTAPKAKLSEVEAQIAAVLPEKAQVHQPAASTQLMRELLTSSEQGLRLTTLFALLMAAFIIINTFLMNVAERRRQLSILRAVGAKKRQVTLMLLGESLLLGVVGTLLGMALGVGTAYFATHTLAHAFQVQLPHLTEVMTPTPFIVGAAFGMCMAFAGALVPALLAGSVSPLEGMNRVVPGRSRNFTWLFLAGGVLLTGGSLAIIFGSIFGILGIDIAAYFGPVLLIGLVMLDSVILGPQVSFVSWLLRPFARVEATLALKQVLRHHARSALTVAVLFIAGSAGVGMANSIIDNVRDVNDWYSQAIVGDYFIRAMMPDMAKGTAPDLPEGIGDDLQKLKNEQKGIAWIDGASFIEARVRPSGGGESDSMTAIVIAREFANHDTPAFDLIPGGGDRDEILPQLLSGQVVVGSVLAQKLNFKLGDKLPLETEQGVQEVPICGIANEYMVGGLSVHMNRKLAEKWLGVHGVDGYIIKAQEDFRDALKAPLEAIAKKYDVILMSRGEIGKMVNQFVAGTQWSLWALVFMLFLVAAFGVANTLAMNVLEQTRELGLLRIVAMTKTQVRRTIVMQALIIGVVGVPPGILFGVGVAYVLNLAMMPSFGHPIHFHMHPEMLIGTLLGAIVIVLIAAIIPARRATRINVVEALHYE